MSNFLKSHPAVAITIIYIYFSLLGVLYEYLYMNSYGINVLNYIEPKDYLISFVKATPIIIAMLIGYFLVFVKDVLLNQRHVPGDKLLDRVLILLVKSRKAEFFILLMSLPVFTFIIGNSAPKELEAYNQIKIDKALANELKISEQLYLINSFGNYLFLATDSNQFIIRKDKLISFEVIRSNKPIKVDK